jgi:hypothetical protein
LLHDGIKKKEFKKERKEGGMNKQKMRKEIKRNSIRNKLKKKGK